MCFNNNNNTMTNNKQQKKYTFIPNSKTSRTQSDMVDMIIDRNGKRQKL